MSMHVCMYVYMYVLEDCKFLYGKITSIACIESNRSQLDL